MDNQARFAPGGRVEIRDCEWIIRQVDSASDGGYILKVEGLSELVSGKSAQFLTSLEDQTLKMLDPAETLLEQDSTAQFEKSRLYIETQLRQIIPADDRIHLAQHAAMDPVPYQLDPALQALKQPRQRILIADAVGLGKTLEAGILVTELMRRGRGKRILVLTLKSMMTQFQKEFWNRFTIPLTRLDSIGLQRVRNNIPGNHNPFYYYDKTIISIDTLKQDNEFRRHLEQAYWDIIVIDEAHNVAKRSGNSLRYKLALLLSHRTDALIMLSATPHDGNSESFASLMNMLDPTAISDPADYVKDDFRDKGLVVRRFKKDIKDQVASEFKERVVTDIRLPATPAEEGAYQALLDVPFTYGGEHSAEKNGHLVRIGLQKAMFSSPAAALVSTRNRLKKLAQHEPGSADEQVEVQALQSLQLALQNIDATQFAKYQQLLHTLKSTEFGWNKKQTDDRLVIFSERIETIRWLQSQLMVDLKLKDTAVTLLHGGLSDIDQQQIVEDFGKTETPLRVLLCSDVASEGINLHYLSHRLVHFDLPWSLMVFQQRNGRVDRYGQSQVPHILYLLTESQNATIQGDLRILEILKDKDQQAYKNIGDPATFMGVYDSQAEEKLTESAMVAHQPAESFDAEYQPSVESNEGEDLLSAFFTPSSAPAETVTASADSHPTDKHCTDGYSLFANDLSFVKQALAALNRDKLVVDYRVNEAANTLSLTASEDLRYRFKYLPIEIRPDNFQFELTTDRVRFDAEVRRSRQDDSAWPKLHYLWPQHPVIDWLSNRITAEVARHSAPVLALSGTLAPGEHVFLVSGLIPNRKAHPVIWHWHAVHCVGAQVVRVEAGIDFLKQLDLTQPRANANLPIDLAALYALRKPVVSAVQQQMAHAQQAFTAEFAPQLVAREAELERLKANQLAQLDLQLSSSAQEAQFKDARREKRSTEINAAFNDYRRWVRDTMTIEPVPYIQIIAAFTSGQH